MGSQKLGQEVSAAEHQIAEQKVKIVKLLVTVRDETAKQVAVMQNSYSNSKKAMDDQFYAARIAAETKKANEMKSLADYKV